MACGYHSKNATFSICNYTIPIFVRGKVIQEELYQGTSKATEGYSARITLKKAKEGGLHIEVHWQDADSSSNVVPQHFGEAKVMICGGHTVTRKAR